MVEVGLRDNGEESGGGGGRWGFHELLMLSVTSVSLTLVCCHSQ